MKTFTVTVSATAKTKLTGNETLELSIDDQGNLGKGSPTSGAVGIEDGGKCAPGSIDDSEGNGIVGTGECRTDGKTAVYDYTVKLNPNYGSKQVYSYEFVGDKGGYEQNFALGETAINVTEWVEINGEKGGVNVLNDSKNE